ncbi:MAG: hypothetical protein JWR34_1085 [Mycobacterium sp.]|nr:hypothetical protein [Mycobacterium sp.]
MTSNDENSRGAPGTGSGGANRPAGTVDEDANPPLSDPDDDTVYGGSGNLPPQDTGSAIPPYEGRETSGKVSGQTDDPGTGGATRPEKDAEYRSQKPADTRGGATASPADEQPASQAPETRGHDKGADAPAHVTGTRRGEDKP